MKINNPPMTFKNSDAKKEWNEGLAKNTDPYGRAVYRFASEWVTRMEKELGTNDPETWIPLNAGRIAHEADNEGITGFMYGYAMSMIAAWWIHGEILRRWHNLETQIGDEGEKANQSGGVLNPAIMNISE